MDKKLKGFRVAILVSDGFEQSEMRDPRKALDQVGAKTTVVSPVKGKVKGWNHKDWGDAFPVDQELKSARPDDFDGLLLPGGQMNPDNLRLLPEAIAFIKHFVDNQKPIAAICHGPWTLINAGGIKNKTVTSWPSIKVDLTNAGANWVDKEVVRDTNLVTSRKPDDLPAFNKAIIEMFSEAIQ